MLWCGCHACSARGKRRARGALHGRFDRRDGDGAGPVFRRRCAAAAQEHRRGGRTRVLWRHAGVYRRAAGARHQAGVGLPLERGDRPAVAPRDDRPAGSGDRRAAGGDGRALHHGSADRGGLGRVGEAPGGPCPRAGRAGDDVRRAATSTRSRASGRSGCASGATYARACAGSWRARAATARWSPPPSPHAAAGGRRHRARNGVARAGPHADVGARRRASASRRVPSRPAGDGQPWCAMPACSSTRARRARRSGRSRDPHLVARSAPRTSRESLATCSAGGSRAARTPPRSRFSSRWGWRSRTWRPRVWHSIVPPSEASAAGSFCRPRGSSFPRREPGAGGVAPYHVW